MKKIYVVLFSLATLLASAPGLKAQSQAEIEAFYKSLTFPHNVQIDTTTSNQVGFLKDISTPDDDGNYWLKLEAFAKGEGPARVTRFEIEPVITYTNAEIREIRKKAKMTQAVFALYMGVSIKTVEAWENGRTHPTGPACRLMTILAEGKEQPDFVRIVS